ncbi:MAG: hypothetical protein R3E89_09530 [Thiolinea sp.]
MISRAKLGSSLRYRGIYEVPVYTNQLAVSYFNSAAAGFADGIC